MRLVALLAVALSASASADEPRWGTIKWDSNTLEYSVPRCAHSKVKNVSARRVNGAIVVRLECEPVPGEVSKPNPELHQ